MAARRRHTRVRRSPAFAVPWRDFAAYIAQIAQIEGSTVEELREAATGKLGDPTRNRPAEIILGALQAADEGRPFNPTDLRARRAM